MSIRNYSTVAVQTSLVEPITSTAAIARVGDTTGWPAPPFTLIIDKDQAAEEVVEVTDVSTPLITITRGMDGSPALPHEAGATVVHGVSSRDFREPNIHWNAASGVHGVTGALVGTTDQQTLDRKTFRSTDGTNPPLTVQQAPGQGTNLVEIRTSTGVLGASLDAGLKLTVPQVETTTGALLRPGAANQTALRVVLRPSQSANGVEVWDASETTLLFGIGPTGNVYAPNLVQDTLNASNVVATNVSTQTLQATSSSSLGACSAQNLSVLAAIAAATANIANGVTAGSVSTTGAVSSGSVSTGAVSASTGSFSGALTHRGSIPVPRQAAGRATVNVNNAFFGVVGITFPIGRFTVAPIVNVTLQSAQGGSGSLSARALNVTAAGCDLYVYTGNNAVTTATGVSLGWHAIQMTDGSAAG